MLSTWVVIFAFQGTQFDFKEDWGEQLISKCCPVLVVYDMTTDEIKVLEGVPENISAGQVGWNTTSVLCIYKRSLPTFTWIFVRYLNLKQRRAFFREKTLLVDESKNAVLLPIINFVNFDQMDQILIQT